MKYASRPHPVRARSLSLLFFLPLPLLLPLLAGCLATEPEQETDGPEPVGEAVHAQTVAQAVNNSCSTTSVKGLSEQIINQGQCINPSAFVKVPSQPNLVLGSAVFPYLELPARDALVSALQSKPGTTMTINSMLRTVAQQYLLYRWYKLGKCGIALAATPGNSNHETGLALDVSQYGTWRTTLENKGFKWFGDSDAVHFDYVGAGAQSYKGLDVLAFQQLWNKNHPEDLIDEDGIYGNDTATRLDKSPAEGFPVGADCSAPKPQPDIHPAIALEGGEDRFSDGESAGVDDVLEGETYTVRLEIMNKGGSPASNVDIGVFIEEPFLVATDYLIESDWMNGGMFKENDANTDPSNPAHGEPLGATFSLKMNALSPNETKRVTLTLAAEGYSIGLADSPDVRLWIKDVPSFYHQDDFNGEAQNVNNSQSFGEKLQVYAPLDIYSKTRWEWDTDRLEGWTPLGATTLKPDPAAKVLLFGGEGEDPGALGPTTSFNAGDLTAIALRAKRTGGEGAARLYFATEAEPEMTDERSIDFDLPDDEAFHEITVRAGAHPLWTGTITGLRIDPFTKGPGTVELDYVRAVVDDGSNGAGGSGSGSASTGASGGVLGPVNEGGCACAVPGGSGGDGGSHETGRSPWSRIATLAAFAALFARRPRRPRRPRRQSHRIQ
jgi:hypothetical protein